MGNPHKWRSIERGGVKVGGGYGGGGGKEGWWRKWRGDDIEDNSIYHMNLTKLLSNG